MANYYQNKLTVLHDSAERIEEVFAAIRTEDRDVIDFNAIIPRPERLNIDHDGMAENAMLWMINRAMPHSLNSFCESMAKRFEEGSEEVKKKQLKKAAELFRNIADYGYPDFYRWSIDHWGTKWNSINGYGQMHRDGNTIYFETANGYCDPVIEELSRKFPDVGFAYAAADEDIGSYTIKGVFNNGEFKGLREHRTPAAFDIAFELFPKEKKDFRQKLDGTWELIRDEED